LFIDVYNEIFCCFSDLQSFASPMGNPKGLSVSIYNAHKARQQ